MISRDPYHTIRQKKGLLHFSESERMYLGCFKRSQPCSDFTGSWTIVKPRGQPPVLRFVGADGCTSAQLKQSWFHTSSFASKKASTVLKTFKNSGLPENESGLTGPMVIKEYCRLLASKAECGSRNN